MPNLSSPPNEWLPTDRQVALLALLMTHADPTTGCVRRDVPPYATVYAALNVRGRKKMKKIVGSLRRKGLLATGPCSACGYGGNDHRRVVLSAVQP